MSNCSLLVLLGLLLLVLLLLNKHRQGYGASDTTICRAKCSYERTKCLGSHAECDRTFYRCWDGCEPQYGEHQPHMYSWCSQMCAPRDFECYSDCVTMNLVHDAM